MHLWREMRFSALLQPIDVISLSFIFATLFRLLLKTSLLRILLKFLVKKLQ